MVDTSVPYKRILMKLDASENIPRPDAELPEHYHFRGYQSGDAEHWARIETSVGEFKTEEDALAYYAKLFLPHEEQLPQRCIFICSPAGIPIATGSAWFCFKDGVKHSQLHWIAVHPEHQKKGLGRAVVQKVLSVFNETAPNDDVYLATQTWSHEAVRLYHRLGFRIMREDFPQLYVPRTAAAPYDIAPALDILREIYDPQLFKEIQERIV